MPPLDDLPGTLVIPGKDAIRDNYCRDYRIRLPGAVTVEGTLVYADAATFADAMAPVFFNAKNIGDHVANVNKSGRALDLELRRSGTERLPATGASGFVRVGASTGGGTIFEGDILTSKSQKSYRCTATRLYHDGDFAPVAGIDTGPSTNLEAGAQLEWAYQRPGIERVAVVVMQTDGSGLTGGRFEENDDEANERLRTLRANPPASGNNSQFIKAVQDTPGLSIQQAYAVSCPFGPGTIAVMFTLRPAIPGANRIPNPTQLAIVHSWLTGQFPGDDSIFVSSLLPYPVDIVYEAKWATGASSWIDMITWPKRIPGDMVCVDPAQTPTALSFRLSTDTDTTSPQPGQSIAFYDRKAGAFRRKRIRTATTIVPNRSWSIIVDTDNGASDTGYTPYVKQAPCPWSDSLQGVITPTTSYFDTVGPGEQFQNFLDPNYRQRRFPTSPTSYGNTITNRLLVPIFSIPSVGDIELKSPDIPFETPPGVPGILSYLLSLGNIAVFPQT